MDIFKTCNDINDLLMINNHSKARNELIILLDYHHKNNIKYSALINHLIRTTGLYPYLQLESSSWQDRYIHEIFKVNTGDNFTTLHIEQSSLLKKLINGDNIAISAPTSFGKSFIIDAYISIVKPANVVIIVPTIALTDETRRRLYKKFSSFYKIITTADVELSENNIFIFPQERAMSYVNRVENIDILIVDEFYKASTEYDKERAPTLLKTIVKFGKKAKQKYFLAPNIKSITENVFMQGIQFEDKLDFNTVFLQVFENYKEIGKNEIIKGEVLLSILRSTKTKSLIYASLYRQIDKISNLLIDSLPVLNNSLLVNFSQWLTINYDANWKITNLIKRGVGVHNGQLHRSISQIQIKLFEEKIGIDTLISTSSIIEGVNTSAENVIIWRSKLSGGNKKLDSFTYKNIIGRGGRMFKYFIGKIYLLEAPPKEELTHLDIQCPEIILGDDEEESYRQFQTEEQIKKTFYFKNDMLNILGKDSYDKIFSSNSFQSNDSDFIKKIALELYNNKKEWNGLAYLNSNEIDSWERLLYKVIQLKPGGWGDGAHSVQHYKFVKFIKVLSFNWTASIPQLLDELEKYSIDIEQFFKLERVVAFNLSALLHDINILQKEILDTDADLSPFITKVSHAFLPPIVYLLEEYGLPRMVSKKIHSSNIINFENFDLTIHQTISLLHQITKEAILNNEIFDQFDKYIIEYFFDGIASQN